jgi:diguanylate cyclase (GGDEF)-like protein
MLDNAGLSQKNLALQKAVLSSLRLKEVLDAVVSQFYSLSGGSRVAVLLADNDSLAFKLMAAKGYSTSTLDLLRTLPFASDSLLKTLVQKRAPAFFDSADSPAQISGRIMKNESSTVQVGLPLIANNLLVGAILLDGSDNSLLQGLQDLSSTAEIASLCIANSIVHGRSEYERERISILYTSSLSLITSVLRTAEVLKIALDSALSLAKTAYGVVLFYNAADDIFDLAAVKGLDASALGQLDLSARDTIAGTTLRSGKTACLGDGLRQPFGLPPAAEGVPFSSAIVLPLIYEHTPLGVIEVFSTEHNAFRPEHVDYLEMLATQVCNALHVSLTHEITEARTLEDVHTGLYSRPYFEESLLKECERSARNRHELGVLMIDIDHLGNINQTLGSDRGDEAIRYVADLIKRTVRDMDVVCRYGGEEFAVILPETAQPLVLEVAERVRQAIRSGNAAGVGMVSVSVGAATLPINGEDADSLVEAAEDALHVAKYQGRNKVVAAFPNKQASVGPISWGELAHQAKLAVISQRQSRLKNPLAPPPEYASWMTRKPKRQEK